MPIPTRLRPIVVYYNNDKYEQMMKSAEQSGHMPLMRNVHSYIGVQPEFENSPGTKLLKSYEVLILAGAPDHVKSFTPNVEGIWMGVAVTDGGTLEEAVAAYFENCRGVIIATNESSRSKVHELLQEYEPVELY